MMKLNSKQLATVIFMMVLANVAYSSIVDTADFCWRNSKVRGVGTIPSQCNQDEDKIGLLCYAKCASNYSRYGFDCHSNCPSGFTNNGLFCRMNQYGRGVGYPWKFGDGFNDRGMYKRCHKKFGVGNCEKWGLIVYPKCKPGYSAFGCCICRPSPNCKSVGLGPRFDISCYKKIIIGNPQTAQCHNQKEYDAGLCYKKCPVGYNGVGPVCWLGAPNGWVVCGLGAAKDSAACAQVTFNQVTSVGALALNIATFGASSSARKVVSAGKDATRLIQLKKKFKKMQDALDKTRQAADLIFKTIQKRQSGSNFGDEAKKALTVDVNNVTEADIIRMTAQIAAILDPTGIADTVASYSYPTCDKIITPS